MMPADPGTGNGEGRHCEALRRNAVIPGREQSERTVVRNCAPENLEIPGSMLRIAPE